MIQPISEIPNIPDSEITPLVKSLLQIIQQQSVLLLQAKEEIQKLRDEIAILKKGNKKPQVPPSSLEKAVSKKSVNMSKGENFLVVLGAMLASSVAILLQV